MKTHRSIRSVLAIATLICGLWASTALAVPSYSFFGYTNSLLINDGEFDAYGYYTLNLVYDSNMATSATSSYVDGLRGTLSFTQDPFIYTNPVDPYLPTGPAVDGVDYSLPNSATTFGGIFEELFALTYENDVLSLDFMDVVNQGPSSLLSFDLGTFDLLALTSPIDLTTYQINEEIAGTIDGYAVSLTTDEINYSAVPEPSTFALIGIGLAGLGLTRRLRGRKQA